MIVIGLICAIIGFVAHIHLLWIIGLILLLVGLVLLALGNFGHPVGGRRNWY